MRPRRAYRRRLALTIGEWKRVTQKSGAKRRYPPRPHARGNVERQFPLQVPPLQLPEQQSALLVHAALLPPQVKVTHRSLSSSHPWSGHGSPPGWQTPPLQVSVPLQNRPSLQSESIEQAEELLLPQNHPLSEQRESPHSSRSPSQQYWPFGLPLVLARQSLGQLPQSSPASHTPLPQTDPPAQPESS